MKRKKERRVKDKIDGNRQNKNGYKEKRMPREGWTGTGMEERKNIRVYPLHDD